MRSSNPVLSRPYTPAPYGAGSPSTAVTLDSVIMRSAMMLGTLVIFGAAAWVLNLPMGFAFIGALVAFGIAMFATFKRKVSPALFLTYAALEGAVIGIISNSYESEYTGIVFQAVLGVVTVFAVMLGLYKARIIRVTAKFTRFVLVAAVAFIAVMLVNLVAGFFVDGGLGLTSGGPLAIGAAAIGVVLGALFYALDFDQVEKLIAAGAPEEESWRAAFGLTLTTVWVYLEILRLLSYFRD